MKRTYAVLALVLALAAVFAAVSVTDGQPVAADEQPEDLNIDFRVSGWLDRDTGTEVVSIVMLETGSWDLTMRIYDGNTEYYTTDCTIRCDEPYQEFQFTGIPALDDLHVYTVSLQERTGDEATRHSGTASLDPFMFQSELWFDRLRYDFEINSDSKMVRGSVEDDGLWYSYYYEVRHFKDSNVHTDDYEVVQSGEAPCYNHQQMYYYSLDYLDTKNILPDGYYSIIMYNGDDLLTYSEPMHIYCGAPLVTATIHINPDLSQVQISSHVPPDGNTQNPTMVTRETFQIVVPQYSYLQYNGMQLDVRSRDMWVSDDVTLVLNKIQMLTDRGYHFHHWSVTEEKFGLENEVIGYFGFDSEDRTLMFHDMHFYPHFEYQIFNITYKDNTYRPEPLNPSTYCILDEIHLQNDSRDGYNFLGWTGNGVTTPTRDLVIPKGTIGDLEFTAHWEVAEYKLTYTNLMGAEDPGNPTSCKAGDDPFYLKNPSLEGKCFVGWTWSQHQLVPRVDELVEDVNENRTYEAHWTDAVYHTITYTNLEGSDNPDNPTKAKYDDEFVLINPIKAGYIFSGWVNENVPEDLQHIRLVMKVSKVDEDRTYRAVWNKIPEYWGVQDTNLRGGGDTTGIPAVSDSVPGPEEGTGDKAVYAVTGFAALATVLGLLLFLRRRI